MTGHPPAEITIRSLAAVPWVSYVPTFAVAVALLVLTRAVKHYLVLPGVLIGASSLMLLLTIVPRTPRSPFFGINFYKGILKYSCEDYCSKMAEIDAAEILKNYLNSIYMIASVEEKKFIRFRLGLISSFIAITLVGSAIIFNILLLRK